MKREEARMIAEKNALVMIEYLEQFMMDKDTISGVMEFSSSNNRMVVDITIRQDGKKVFGRGYDMGVSYVYADLITKEISERLLETFMPSESYGVGEYACIKDHPTMSRDGIYVFNDHNSRVNVNFRTKGEEFANIMRTHNERIREYRNQTQSSGPKR